MIDIPHVELSKGRVLQAIETFGKLRLATQAGIAESNLRGASREHWNPTAETLRKLEIAAAELAAEDAGAEVSAHRESRAPILGGGAS